MNGRIFDATLGVFLQADPMIGQSGDLQNYNRYGYCFNNPAHVYRSDGLRLLVEGQAQTRFSSALVISDGNPKAALKGGLEGAFSGAVFSGVGDYIQANDLSTADGIGVHAVAGCVTGVASGAKCGPSALSAAFSKAVAPATYAVTQGDPVSGAVASAIVGGTASVLGGGKFANGAQTGAFSYLFNECQHRMCGSNSTSVRVTGNSVVGDLAHVEIEISSGYDFVVLEARPGPNGRLVDTSNGPNWGSAFSYEVTPPAGETTASIGLKLQEAAGLYRNDLWYSVPSPQYSLGRVMDYGYNSNSYVGALIENVLPGSGIRWAIQAAAQARGFRVPGMEKPIPLGGPR